ncbi:hypothetical protein SOVF_096510 isoform A [Spinacia oleracea]|nr:hypothetical protein SOVF_096510 isoform A [Spinacia oleracea]
MGRIMRNQMVGLFLQGDSKRGFHGGRYGEDLGEGIGREGYGKGIWKGISSGRATPVSISGRSESVVFMEEDGPKESVSQVEHGVLITFFPHPKVEDLSVQIRTSKRHFKEAGEE